MQALETAVDAGPNTFAEVRGAAGHLAAAIDHFQEAAVILGLPAEAPLGPIVEERSRPPTRPVCVANWLLRSRRITLEARLAAGVADLKDFGLSLVDEAGQEAVAIEALLRGSLAVVMKLDLHGLGVRIPLELGPGGVPKLGSTLLPKPATGVAVAVNAGHVSGGGSLNVVGFLGGPATRATSRCVSARSKSRLSASRPTSPADRWPSSAGASPSRS